MDKEELVDARGGWTPGKLEYKPLFAFPPILPEQQSILMGNRKWILITNFII